MDFGKVNTQVYHRKDARKGTGVLLSSSLACSRQAVFDDVA